MEKAPPDLPKLFPGVRTDVVLSVPCLQAHGLIRDLHTVGEGDTQMTIYRYRDERKFDE
jgi:hypothetical protein